MNKEKIHELWDSQNKDEMLATYQAMMALERQKASIYSNLWTFLFSGIILLLGFYYRSDNPDSFKILLAVPPVILIWLHFILFNHFYLRNLREYINFIEEKLKLRPSWFRDIFESGAWLFKNPFLSVLVAIFGVIGYGFVVYFAAENLSPCWKSFYTIIICLFAIIEIFYYYLARRKFIRFAEEFPYLHNIKDL